MSLCYSFILLRTVRRPFLLQKRTPGGVLQVEDIQDFTNNTSGEESKPALKNNDEGWQQYEAGRT